jgi:AraC-like DNA-binding protein
MAIDCCEHVTGAFTGLPASFLPRINSRQLLEVGGLAIKHPSQPGLEIDLIVIGVAAYPVRRPFISTMRQIYLDVPVLILRREKIRAGREGEIIRGEFVLSDRPSALDLKVVQSVRKALPLNPCPHTRGGKNFDIVRQVMRIIGDGYQDPDLSLQQVAKAITISASRLSNILNRQVGVSFRQLLKNTRIEEAKRMLTSRGLSVKEIALRVGFSDSHYFSRIFKEETGLRATEFRAREPTSRPTAPIELQITPQ